MSRPLTDWPSIHGAIWCVLMTSALYAATKDQIIIAGFLVGLSSAFLFPTTKGT